MLYWLLSAVLNSSQHLIDGIKCQPKSPCFVAIFLSSPILCKYFTGRLHNNCSTRGVSSRFTWSSQIDKSPSFYLTQGRNSKQINIAKYISNFLICGAKMSDKCVKSKKKKFLYIVLFCKVKLSKMASIKTNKIKKQTELF